MSEDNSLPVHDVLIIGAGLASLTLAKQLLDRQPTLDICIVHNRRFPYPERVHKVGESTVEIGAYYLSRIIGCKEHLEECHLRKMGQRFIQTQGLRGDAPYRELGLTFYPHHSTFQIDRGRLENYLRGVLGGRITMMENCRVLDMVIGDGRNIVSLRDHEGNVASRKARWVVDASGRGRVLMRQFHLQRKSHVDHSAVWFRVGGNVDINEFINSADGTGLFAGVTERGRSTTHLLGQGYWVWIIPINEQTTSIGIVFDNAIHKLSDMSSYPLAANWLRQNEPRLMDYLEHKSFKTLDFMMMRNYSYLSTQYISKDGWALTGEAAGFVDPMYSNGTDLIALANTLITDAIIRPDGMDLIDRINGLLEEVYNGFDDTHRDSGGRLGIWSHIFIKANWDSCFYFMFMCVLFMNDKFADISFVERIHETIAAFYKVHHQVLSYLRSADRHDDYHLPDFIELAGSLQDYANGSIFMDDKSDDAVEARLKENLAIMHRLAAAIIETKTFDTCFFNPERALRTA